MLQASSRLRGAEEWDPQLAKTTKASDRMPENRAIVFCPSLLLFLIVFPKATGVSVKMKGRLFDAMWPSASKGRLSMPDRDVSGFGVNLHFVVGTLERLARTL